MKLLDQLINRYQLNLLKPTKKTRTELRHQKFVVRGVTVLGLDYADSVASQMPTLYHLGKLVDHKQRIRRMYYKFDLAGINYYYKSVHRMIKYVRVQTPNKK